MDDWKRDEGKPENRPLRYLTPLANDVIYVREMVSHHLSHFDYGPGMRRKSVFQDYFKRKPRTLFLDMFEHSEGYNLPNPVEVLFTGLFRTNLYLSESDTESAQLVGWFRDLENLWRERSEAVLNELQGDFKDNNGDPKDFIRANATFTHDFYLYGMSDGLEEMPEIVYRVHEDDKARYHRVDDPNEATHELTVHKDPDVEDELVRARDEISEVPMKRVELTDAFEYATLE